MNEPPCPRCQSKNIITIYRPEVYEFDYFCRDCDFGFNRLPKENAPWLGPPAGEPIKQDLVELIQLLEKDKMTNLYEALKAEGFLLPDECSEVYMTTPIDGLPQLHYTVNLRNDDLTKVGRALQQMAGSGPTANETYLGHAFNPLTGLCMNCGLTVREVRSQNLCVGKKD